MEELSYYYLGEKYNVIFDRDELRDIRHSAVLYASTKIHLDYEGSYYKSPYYKKNDFYSEILNYNQELIRIEKDDYGKNRKIYHYSFDKVYYPYITKLIDKLLEGDVSVLDEIYKPNLVKEMVPIYTSIDMLEKRLSNLDCNDFRNKLEILYELEYLTKRARDTRDDVKVLDYYEALGNAISIKKDKELTLTK